jgi:histone acetyltransferase (RNA polymerase elongator complex component)
MNPSIIPIFLPGLGCRQRCLFCNQKAASEGLLPPSSIRKSIEASLAAIPAGRQKGGERQVAFYGGSFTGIDREDQIRYLKEVQPFISSGVIDSIRISTRPDVLGEETLSPLEAYRVKTVEIGGQSMIDEVLLFAHRGHRAADTASAVLRLRRLGFEVGLHLMIGLPGDTCDRFLQTLDRVIDLRPDFVRIHPTLVLKGAPLEDLWRAKRYHPLALDEAIEWLKRGLLKLERSSMPVARIGLQTTKELERDLLAGPYHPAIRQVVDSAIALEMAVELIKISPREPRPLFFCHPAEVSNVRGQKNGNVQKLRERFGLGEIMVRGREDMPRGSLALQTRSGEALIHRRDLVA